MLTLRDMNPAEAMAWLGGRHPLEHLTQGEWAAYCHGHGLLAFAAYQDGRLAAVALAESHPRVLQIIKVKGKAPACCLLLRRLVCLAGERDVSGWFPADRADVLEMLERLGFTCRARGDFQGRPSYRYHLCRNEDNAT